MPGVWAPTRRKLAGSSRLYLTAYTKKWITYREFLPESMIPAEKDL